MAKDGGTYDYDRRFDLVRLVGLSLLLLAAAIFAYSADYPSLAKVRSDIHQLGDKAPIIFILIYALATLIFVPKNLLSIAAGGIFGALPATIYVVVGATLGAMIAYLGARKIGRSAVERLFGQKISRIDAQLGEKSFQGILIARLVPIMPFTLLNYAAGLSAVKFLPYIGATVIGMIPGTASYVALGAYGAHLQSWEFVVAAAIVLGFIYFTQKIARKHND